MHGGHDAPLLDGQPFALLQTAQRKLDETICENIRHVLEVDHRGQNVLRPRPFALMVQCLLIADVGEIAANGLTQLVHAFGLPRQCCRVAATRRAR